MARHHGHQAGAVNVAELLNRQVNPCQPGFPATVSSGHLKGELPQREPGEVSPPIKRFYIQDDPDLLARVLAGLRQLA